MKRSGGFGTGTASILIIFVLLCLTTFATLSLVSAQADLRLSRRAAQSLSDYYAADSAATEQLAQVVRSIETVDAAHFSESAFLDECALRATEQFTGITTERIDGGLLLRYREPIDDRRALSIALRISYPTRPDEMCWHLYEWRSIQTGEWVEPNNTVNLWHGETAGLPNLEGS